MANADQNTACGAKREWSEAFGADDPQSRLDVFFFFFQLQLHFVWFYLANSKAVAALYLSLLLKFMYYGDKFFALFMD